MRSKIKLSAISDITVGYPFKSEQFNTDNEGVRLLRGKNITTGSLRWGDDTRWWSDLSLDYSRYELRKDDIVIVMDGSLVGKNYARIRDKDLPLLLVQRVACIRAKEGIDQQFLWNCIANPQFVQYIDRVKTGTSIPHISGKQIGDYEIPCFTFSEQQRIGCIFYAIEERIEANKQINNNLAA